MPFGRSDDVDGRETGPWCLYAKRTHQATVRAEYLDTTHPAIVGHHGIPRERAHESQQLMFAGTLPLSRRTRNEGPFRVIAP